MAIMNRLTDDLFKAAGRRAAEAVENADGEGFSLPVKDWLCKAEKLVKSNPGVSLLAAAGVGILLGWLVKRK